MKSHLLFLFMLLLAGSLKAESLPAKIDYFNFDQFSFKDNQIKVAGKYKGKYNVDVKDINVNGREKTTIYEVTIFDEIGLSVAKLRLQIKGKPKNKNFTIIDANLKTTKDNVTHNSSNFINYEEINAVRSEEFEVPQFDNVVKYLLSYKYL